MNEKGESHFAEIPQESSVEAYSRANITCERSAHAYLHGYSLRYGGLH